MELDAILDNLSDEEQIELLELLEEEENYRNTHLLYEFTPYSKQREFIDAGHDYPERCFMAGNQLGKSFTGAAEVAFHLTGRYPGTKGYPADGKCGLRIKVVSSKGNASSATGVDDADSARLTDSAQRDYWSLRERIETSNKMILGLQEYINTQCLK
ncbi:hypothetical protein J9N25_002234 [Salmonella enterica]|nr:hypothetical protein [Salmonella enterica]